MPFVLAYFSYILVVMDVSMIWKYIQQNQFKNPSLSAKFSSDLDSERKFPYYFTSFLLATIY
jgi:hypothetical protein